MLQAEVKSMSNESNKQTHFGYQQVSESEKGRLVGDVFDSVANRYDLMNDLMSFGIHRIWKKIALAHTGIRHNSCVLDVASGTGDLSLAIAKRLGPKGRLILTDINASMLRIGQDRMIDQGYLQNVYQVRSDSENLAFADDSFDCITVSFGLRNVTRIHQALASIFRVVRPGGRVVILEFSKPVIPLLEEIYDGYSFTVIPRIGELVVKDRESYQYLVESIRRHPNQEALVDMMVDAGFERVEYHNLTFGVVALHIGRKL